MKIVNLGLGFGLGFLAAVKLLSVGMRHGYIENGNLDWLETAIRNDLVRKGYQVPGMNSDIYAQNEKVFEEFARDPLGFDRGLRD